MQTSKVRHPDGNTLYVFHCEYDERHLPKAARFQWNDIQKRWQTEKIADAAKLREFADFTCRDELTLITVRQSTVDQIELVYKKVQEAKHESELEREVIEARRLATQCSEEEKMSLFAAVPKGNYMLDIDKRPRIFQVRVSASGNQYVRDGDGHYLGFRTDLLRILAASDLQSAGRRYGTTTGRCWRCNRHLTDAISNILGVGPECGTDEHTAYKASITGVRLTD